MAFTNPSDFDALGKNRLQRGREYYLVFLLYLAASLALTWPVSWRMGSELPVGGDSWQNNWNLWWTARAVDESDLSLLQCPLIFHPGGLSLALHSNSYFNTLLSLPLRRWISFERIHYFLIWIYFPLSAMGAYLLAKRWIRSPLAALMAGWIYAFSPYRIGRYIIEQIDILSTAWIPLFVLFMLAFLDRPRWRTALAAAVCLFFQLLSSWYNGAYCLVFLVFAFVFYWMEDRLPWQHRKFWPGLAVIVVVPGLLLSPWILPMLNDLRSPLFAAQVDQSEVAKVTSSDLIAFVLPSVMYPSFLDQTIGWHGPLPQAFLRGLSGRVLEGRGSNILEATCYVGWTVAVLFFWALVCLKKRKPWAGCDGRMVRFWVVGAVVFGLLALGPILQIAGWKTSVPLPGVLIQALPGFSVLRAPVRFAILLTLALGICAAFVLDRWMVSGRRRRALVFSILIAVDLAMVPVNRLYEGRPVPEVYRQIASDPQPGAILEIPGGYEFPSAWYNVRSMYYQTRHGRPLLVGYISRTPRDPWGLLERYPIVRALSLESLTGAIAFREVTSERALEDLRSLGVRFIVLNPRDLLEASGGDEEAVSRARQLVHQSVGEPVWETPEALVFRIEPDAVGLLY